MRYTDQLNQNGFVVIANIYSEAEIDTIIGLLPRVPVTDGRYGIQKLLQQTEGLPELLLNQKLRTLLTEVAPEHFIVESVYSDKPPAQTWHQDKTVFVKEKIESFGFKNWTTRESEWCVQPPAEISGSMITVRIHLDDTDANNGALKVIPNSHSEASIRPAILSSFSDADATVCEVPAGGVMLMKPLLAHSSSRSTAGEPRRVIHLDLCNMDLPDGLEWSQKCMYL